MTCIAWDGSILACDSRVTAGSSITSNDVNKLFVVKDTNIIYNNDAIKAYALCGKVSDFDYIHAYIRSEEFPLYEKLAHKVGGIFVGDRSVYMLEPSCSLFITFKHSQKLSMGSGEDLAMSAMGLGLSAPQAVKHVFKYDTGCGGKVRSWKSE